jgi:DNA-binding CsgD family transcriptional regulator
MIKEMLLTRWQKQHQQLPPRSLLLVLNLQESHQIVTFGLESLGLEDSKIYSIQQLIERCPSGQQRLLRYYFKAMREHWNTDIQNALWSQQREFLLSIHTAVLALESREEDYSAIYLTVEPLVENRTEASPLVFIWGHLLGQHRGEPLEVNLVQQKAVENSETVTLLDSWLKTVRREIYHRLRFTKVQKTIIKALSQQQKNVPEIAHELQLSIRTVEGHCRNILTHARRVFQQPQFRTAQEVVAYLKRQHFLD